MSVDLHRVVYLSSATQQFPPEALEELLVAARDNNTRRQVTGLLLYHDGNFLQILEGPRNAVIETLECIRRDRRHAGLINLENRACMRITFPEWSMGYLPMNELSAPQRAGFVSLADAAYGRKNLAMCRDTPVAVFLDSFLDSFRELAAV